MSSGFTSCLWPTANMMETTTSRSAWRASLQIRTQAEHRLELEDLRVSEAMVLWIVRCSPCSRIMRSWSERKPLRIPSSSSRSSNCSSATTSCRQTMRMPRLRPRSSRRSRRNTLRHTKRRTRKLSHYRRHWLRGHKTCSSRRRNWTRKKRISRHWQRMSRT